MNRIAIIDMDSICYHIFHPNKVLDKYGKPTRTDDNKRFIYQDKTIEELISCSDLLIEQILNRGGFTGYIGFIKGVNTTLSRKIVNPDYKSNRNTEPPKYWGFVKDYLVKNWNIIEADDIEVDDAVNITRLNIIDSYIVAIDQDLLNLESINPHYNWLKNIWINTSKKEEVYSFWKDICTGQAGDGVKGLSGIGKQNEIFTKNIFKPTPEYVLSLYIHKLGEEKGIHEFFKTYHSLKILDKCDDFIIPEINIYNKSINVIEEKREEEW